MDTARKALCTAMFATLATVAQAQRPGSLARAATTTRRPDAFGTTNYTVTVIPALSFTSDEPLYTYPASLFRTSADGDQLAFAGVDVPAGAVIDFIGVENYGLEGTTATLFYVDQHSGTTLGVVGLTTSGGGYHTDYNETPLGWQLVQNAHNALVLAVYFPSSDFSYSHYLGWIEVWWRRSISNPPGVPTFNDVPFRDPSYAYVEALAKSGVTGGCGNGNFCPDATLTRRQMAVFLSKALGLHWPN